MRSRAQLVLATAAVGVGLIGVTYLVSPQVMYTLYGLTVEGVNEFSLLRSAVGGLFSCFTVLFALGAMRAGYERPALLALLAFMGGFAIGRAVSLVVDGVPSPIVLFLFAVEALYAAAAGWLLSRPHRG
jgi:hypothetical protein